MENLFKKTFLIITYILAGFGLLLIAGFFSLRFGLTKTGGVIDVNDRYFPGFFGRRKTDQINSKISPDYCKLAVIGRFYPAIAHGLFEIMSQPNFELFLAKAIEAQEIYLVNDKKYINGVEICRQTLGEVDFETEDFYSWQNLSEWQTLREAIIKDQEVIKNVAKKAQIDSRLLVSVLVVEQLRLFTSEREIYKQIFQPLKILGTQSKFSWGVMGMKEETAIQVEKNLETPQSVFYLGSEFSKLLDFPIKENQTAQRFSRLTDQRDHYYSYLYSALFLKQIISQWQKAGYDISGRPEILATLFNLGFDKSEPKLNPEAGGSQVEINGEKYSFGGLAFHFYYSGELAGLFPLSN